MRSLVVGPEDSAPTVDDDLVTFLGNNLEDDLFLILALSGDLPHLCDEGVAWVDRGGEATSDGFEGVCVRVAKGLDDGVGGVAVGTEAVEDGLFEPDAGGDLGINVQWVVVAVRQGKSRGRD